MREARGCKRHQGHCSSLTSQLLSQLLRRPYTLLLTNIIRWPRGPMDRPTEPEIAGSSPAGVMFSYAGVRWADVDWSYRHDVGDLSGPPLAPCAKGATATHAGERGDKTSQNKILFWNKKSFRNFQAGWNATQWACPIRYVCEYPYTNI